MAHLNELDGSRTMEEDTPPRTASLRDETTRDEVMRARDDTTEEGETGLPELTEIELPPAIADLHVDVIGLFHQLKAACDAQRAHVLVLTAEIKAERAKRIELEARLREPQQSGRTIVVRDGLPDKQPDPFTGKGEIKSWLRDLENLLGRKQEDHKNWVPYAVQFLQGSARQRWELDHPEGTTLPSWGPFCKEMREKYKKEESVSVILDKIGKLKQGKGDWIESLNDYAHQFETLWHKLGGARTTEDKVDKFLEGLDPEVRNRCSYAISVDYSLSTKYESMKETALNCAKFLARTEPREAGMGMRSDDRGPRQEKLREQLQQRPTPLDRGKGRADSPPRNKRFQPHQRSRDEDVKCYICHRRGHIARDCRNKKPKNHDGAGPSSRPGPNNKGNGRPR